MAELFGSSTRGVELTHPATNVPRNGRDGLPSGALAIPKHGFRAIIIPTAAAIEFRRFVPDDVEQRD